MAEWTNKAREADFLARAFKFVDGLTFDLKLYYRTLGALSASRDNAVLMLHGTTAHSKQFLRPTTADFLFGKGQPPAPILTASSSGRRQRVVVAAMLFESDRLRRPTESSLINKRPGQGSSARLGIWRPGKTASGVLR
jgi:hypothetical protein